MIEASKENDTLYLLPTYTAMLEIRKSSRNAITKRILGEDNMYELKICHLYPDLLRSLVTVEV